VTLSDRFSRFSGPRSGARPVRALPTSRALGAAVLGHALIAGGLAGCASEGAPDTRRELLESWTRDLIVPLYADFEDRSSAVQASLDGLCSAPTRDALVAAQSAWSDAREPLKRAEVFAFGPYSRPEFRIGPKIDSWPARPPEIEELLAGETAVDPASVAELGIWLKGMPAIEYLIYPLDGSLAALAEPRRCEYLRSLGDELVSRARELHLAWAPEGQNFADQVSGAGRTSTAFRSLRDAFSEVINRMGFTVENVRRDKLGGPLGDAAGGTANPDVAESRFSGRSIQDILDNLAGLEVLYFGDPARNLPGVTRYAAERGQNFDERVTAAIGAARGALSALAVPLTEAVSSEPERVREASARLGELQTLFQVDLIGALGLSLSFNDNDGD
jgi:predicted lipoprotein